MKYPPQTTKEKAGRQCNISPATSSCLWDVNTCFDNAREAQGNNSGYSKGSWLKSSSCENTHILQKQMDKVQASKVLMSFSHYVKYKRTSWRTDLSFTAQRILQCHFISQLCLDSCELLLPCTQTPWTKWCLEWSHLHHLSMKRHWTSISALWSPRREQQRRQKGKALTALTCCRHG